MAAPHPRNARSAHPVCGCLKPLWAHRESGPCDWCVRDVARNYAAFIPLAAAAPLLTLEDVRALRAPLLAATDWVDNNPARVAREPAAYVSAIHAYRAALFDITRAFNGTADWPRLPERDAFTSN